MFVTVFRNRLRPGHEAEYRDWAGRMHALARRQPGFLSIKTFQADDGERVSIVEFASEEAIDAWRAHPEHREAQRLGRARFYSEFELITAPVTRRIRFPED